MKDLESVRSPLDRVPFVIRALLAGALALSMILISAAVGLTLLVAVVDATPGRHANRARPARIVAVGIREQAKHSVAGVRRVVRFDARVPCPLTAEGGSCELPRGRLLRSLVRHTFE